MGSLEKSRRISVFCGSSQGNDPAYREAAEQLGEELAKRSLGLVYGGGSIGLMGVLADAVMKGGGEVIGVIPRLLFDREVGHEGLTELRVTETMHERKHLMYELGDAVVALPGGIGTFDELFEALTWNQLEIHEKPTGLLDAVGYFDPLVAMLDRAVQEGFLSARIRKTLAVETKASALLDRLIVDSF